MAQFQVIRAQVQSGEAACCRNANEAQRKRERERKLNSCSGLTGVNQWVEVTAGWVL